MGLWFMLVYLFEGWIISGIITSSHPHLIFQSPKFVLQHVSLKLGIWTRDKGSLVTIVHSTSGMVHVPYKDCYTVLSWDTYMYMYRDFDLHTIFACQL